MFCVVLVASDSVEGQSVLIELETVETPEAAAEVTEIDPSESTRAADMLEGATNSEESAVNNNTPVVLSSQKIEVDNETSEIDLPVQDLKTPEGTLIGEKVRTSMVPVFN